MTRSNLIFILIVVSIRSSRRVHVDLRARPGWSQNIIIVIAVIAVATFSAATACTSYIVFLPRHILGELFSSCAEPAANLGTLTILSTSHPSLFVEDLKLLFLVLDFGSIVFGGNGAFSGV